MMIVARTLRPALQRPQWARAFAASPWGGETWRYDKDAFKQWCKNCTAPGNSEAKGEMHNFLAMNFGDVDANKDGFITDKEFDQLCEKVAALPRRFGLAPSWVDAFNGDADKRQAARKNMFDGLDTDKANKIGIEQFLRWANAHLVQKVATVDTKTNVDFYNITDYDEATFITYVEYALDNPSSGAYSSFYGFLLAIFIETDVESKGYINREGFNDLLSRAAKVPRAFGLAPSEVSKEERDAIFKSMDSNGEGYITFWKFLEWTAGHTKLKIKKQRAGEGYKK